MVLNAITIRSTLLLVILSIISTSCTVYDHNLKNEDGLGISSQDLDNMAIGDMVQIKLKEGKVVVGEMIEQNDTFINLRHKSQTKTNSIIMLDQIASMKYKVNSYQTTVKSIEVSALTVVIISLLIIVTQVPIIGWK